MPRFFVRQDQVSENGIILRGEDAHHIARSLRMAVGDKLTVCDMQGIQYECEIESFLDDKEVNVTISSKKNSENEPPCYIRLYQALPKGDKLDMIIQKAVECGASEIIPFESERCVVKVKPDAESRKTERRQRIAVEAAKQCGRSFLPIVSPTVSFDDMLYGIKNDDICIFCYEGDNTESIGGCLRRNRELLKREGGATLSIIIGSEGGFSINESERLRRGGAETVGLGKRILRTETASGFVLSCIAYVTELDG